MKQILKRIPFLNYEIHTLEYENHLIALLSAVICLASGIMNLLFFELLYTMDFADIIKNSVIFFLFGAAYLLCAKFIKNQKQVRQLMNLLTLALTVCFVLIYYPLIGPTVWTYAFVVVIVALLRENRGSLILISLTLSALGIYAWCTRANFIMDDNYYISQFVAFAVLFLVAGVVFEHYKRVNLTIVTQLSKMQMMTIEQEQRQEEINQLSRMKDVVLAINHKLAEDFNMDEFFNYILSRVSEVMPNADLGCILMLDDEGYLSMAASFGYLQENNSNFRLPLKESFAYRIAGEDYKNTVIINDIQILLNPDYVDMMDNKDSYLVQSSISGPIYKDNKLYGIINIDSKENNVYTENDIAIMEYLREQLGLALSNREMFHQYAFLSKHDQLTGFHNRWYLQELENDHIPRWQRYSTDVLMVVTDLNDLKKLNDELGHHEGDNYIKTYSLAIKNVFRSTDIYIRLGGDEFAGIFFHLSEQELISKLNEVNQIIADSEIQKKAHNLKLGFAYGIVRFGDPSFSIKEIIQIADAKMYCHKAQIKEQQCY